MDGRLRRIGEDLLPPGLLVLGLVLLVAGSPTVGLSLVLAGMVARLTLQSVRRRHDLAHLIDGMTVGEVMETDPLIVAPQATLSTFAPSLEASTETTVARVMRENQLVGLVGERELRRVPRASWPTVHAAEAMASADDLPALAPGDPLQPAADQLGASHASGFPVIVDERVAGVLTRFAVGRTLHERSVAAAAPRGSGPGGARADPEE
jgi:CBS domain-containing protein